nr:catechol oxidase [Ipomoea batatas]
MDEIEELKQEYWCLDGAQMMFRCTLVIHKCCLKFRSELEVKWKCKVKYRGGDLYLNDDNEPEAGKLKAEYARSFVSSLSLDLNEPLEDLGVEDDDAVLIDDGNGRFEELRCRWARLHFSGDGQTPTTSVPAGSGGRRLRGYSSSTVQQQLTFDEIGVGDGVKC